MSMQPETQALISPTLIRDDATGGRLVKRSIDLTGAVVGLLLLSPLMLLVALVIRLDSGGPIIFRQIRIGRGGRYFWILKFRTMTPDAESRVAEYDALKDSSEGLSALKRDPRVTRVGRFLRDTSLDELPQLVNVLRGEMSLVGPRPLHRADCERIEALDPQCFEKRLLVPPGVTGLAQISGRRQLSHQDMLKLDREYVENWSIGRDLSILIRTFHTVLSGRGAV